MSVERLAELFRTHQPAVALTGAGISTESGIPDFRSATGVWAQYDPMEVAHIDAFHADPAKVWEFYALRLDVVGDAEPNDGHRALAALEERGWLAAVITQNVDGLHERAGTRELVEVHGSLDAAHCLRCGATVTRDELAELLPLPECPECGAILKPGVVMFGEYLPEAALAKARRLAGEARLLLAVGSTLEVYPVAALPEETLANGGALAIVNRGATPWDGGAEVVVDAGAGETLCALADALPARPHE
ncbi:MAG TPA: NAD-dependent deacylase [Gaiellaceae bacterium]|nr:NAD-dependent deacylase [Gaiellaceae bacterium]